MKPNETKTVRKKFKPGDRVTYHGRSPVETGTVEAVTSHFVFVAFDRSEGGGQQATSAGCYEKDLELLKEKI